MSASQVHVSAVILKLRSVKTDIQDLTPNVFLFLVWVQRELVVILDLNDEENRHYTESKVLVDISVRRFDVRITLWYKSMKCCDGDVGGSFRLDFFGLIALRLQWLTIHFFDPYSYSWTYFSISASTCRSWLRWVLFWFAIESSVWLHSSFDPFTSLLFISLLNQLYVATVRGCKEDLVSTNRNSWKWKAFTVRRWRITDHEQRRSGRSRSQEKGMLCLRKSQHVLLCLVEKKNRIDKTLSWGRDRKVQKRTDGVSKKK